jgi:hypothetical protein
MSLLTEINLITEGHISEKELVRMFMDAEENGKLNIFVPDEEFEVRPAQIHEKFKINGKTRVAKPNHFMVRRKGSTEPMDLISKTELQDKYTPIRSNQHPDAEGFITYKSQKEVEAFKYTDSEPKAFTVGGHTVKINKNDYVARYVDQRRVVFVSNNSDFENSYILSK